MVEICELDVPRRELLECPPCTEIFFERVGSLSLPIGRTTFPLIVTRRYLLRKCFEGLAVGQHVHSLTLLPKEELQIEIVRRSKFSRALHEQRSVESEFRFELQSTARDEWSREEESNFKITGEEGFKIFGIGAKSNQEYSTREKAAEEHFSEVVRKTSSRVSQKFEIAIDTKTEVENQYRSVRRLSNPNPCQPVIYNYFQLAKKYKTELILTDVRFDLRVQPRPVFERPLGAVAFEADPPYRQTLDLNVVAPPPPWRVSVPAGATSAPQTQSFFLSRTAIAAFPSLAEALIARKPAVEVPVEPPEALELTKEELLQKAAAVRVDVDLKQLERALDTFLADDVNKPGVRATYEYCINTDGLYVEANLSKCSACDEFAIELHRLEVERARVELELKKKELEERSAEG